MRGDISRVVAPCLESSSGHRHHGRPTTNSTQDLDDAPHLQVDVMTHLTLREAGIGVGLARSWDSNSAQPVGGQRRQMWRLEHCAWCGPDHEGFGENG